MADRFLIGALIGEGAMGEVYAGVDEREARPVAIKRLRAAGASTAGLLDRFAREGAILRAIAHPNIVAVLAVCTDAEGPAIVMEFVEGGSLADLLAEQPQLPVDRVLALAMDIADGLARAHRLGVIHRDIKPANVLLAADGTPRLSDFGIAHFADALKLTGTGVVLGTLPYLSPEGWDGERADARSDIWSFGVMLYEMLAGRLPFQASFPGLLYAAIATAEPEALHFVRSDIPPELSAIVARMLAKDPAERLDSVREVGLLADRLLRGESGARWTHEPRVAVPLPASSLPDVSTPLVGREAEIAEVTRILSDGHVRVLTLTGPGGCGKTRLAIEAARRLAPAFYDGVTFVDLTAISDAALVLPEIAIALGVEEDLVRSLDDLIAERLRSEHRLLVLDNFEQVTAAGPALSTIMVSARHAAALVTSRFALRVSAEREFSLSPLSLPPTEGADTPESVMASEAGAFFVGRAQAASRNFVLETANAPVVAAICRRLDGLPLALSLAAARVRALPLTFVLERLAQPLALLTQGNADGVARHRSLHAAISWSHDLLDERDRTLYRRLGVFSGGWSLRDAEVVALDEGVDLFALVDMLQSLVEKSFIMPEISLGEPRYSMLVTLREFASEQLRASPDRLKTPERHARHHALEAHRRAGEVSTRRQADALAWFAAEHDNLRSALAWAESNDGALLLDLAATMGLFWYFAGHWLEALRWYRRALDVGPAALDGSRAAVLDHMGRLEMFLGDETSALRHHEEAMRLALTNGGSILVARIAEGLGEVLLKTGDHSRALSVLAESAARARGAGEPATLAASITTLATAHVTLGDLPRAEELLREALDLAHASGDRFILTKIHYYLAGLALLRDDAGSARALSESARTMANESGDQSWVFHVDEMLARSIVLTMPEGQAATMARRSLEAFHASGSRSCLPHSFETAARLIMAHGGGSTESLRRAASLIGAADGMCARLAIVMLPVERALLGQTRSRLFGVMGAADFEAAHGHGQSWSEDEAFARARGAG